MIEVRSLIGLRTTDILRKLIKNLRKYSHFKSTYETYFCSTEFSHLMDEVIDLYSFAVEFRGIKISRA